MTETSRPEKICFVTVGATASFNRLVSTVLQPHFLSTLRKAEFTHLRIQHGEGGRQPFDFFMTAVGDRVQADTGIKVSGFDFNKAGLHDELKAVKGGHGGVEGTVVSHAGSGSILDALRLGLPIVVVPNPGLMDNHQVELAEVLSEQEYVVLDDIK
jgi:beta-1,4-N-acetylglucosaminyltransferase